MRISEEEPGAAEFEPAGMVVPNPSTPLRRVNPGANRERGGKTVSGGRLGHSGAGHLHDGGEWRSSTSRVAFEFEGYVSHFAREYLGLSAAIGSASDEVLDERDTIATRAGGVRERGPRTLFQPRDP